MARACCCVHNGRPVRLFKPSMQSMNTHSVHRSRIGRHEHCEPTESKDPDELDREKHTADDSENHANIGHLTTGRIHAAAVDGGQIGLAHDPGKNTQWPALDEGKNAQNENCRTSMRCHPDLLLESAYIERVAGRHCPFDALEYDILKLPPFSS